MRLKKNKKIEADDLSFFEAISKYHKEWYELTKEAGEDPCLLPEWILAIAKSLDKCDILRVWVAQRDGTVIAVIPYMRNRINFHGLRLNSVELAGNMLSYHQEILATSDYLDCCVEAFLTSFPSDSWDLFRIENVLAGGASWYSLQRIANAQNKTLVTSPADCSPVLFIDSDWDTFLSSRSSSFRYRLRRNAKKIAKIAGVEMKWLNTQKSVADLIKAMITIESRSWKVGKNMAITDSKQEIEYYRNLLPFLAQRDMLFSNVLYFDGEAVAYSLCYKYQGRIAQLKTSFDDQYSKLSPGSYVVDTAIEKAFYEQAREFDFLGDVMVHKLDWTQETRQHYCIYLFNRTLKGIASSYGKRLREAIRMRDR